MDRSLAACSVSRSDTMVLEAVPRGIRDRRQQVHRTPFRPSALADRRRTGPSALCPDFPRHFRRCAGWIETPACNLKAKIAANGQVSRALSYLSTALDWASHRGKFTKIGAGRKRALRTPVVRDVHDPPTEDPRITGMRERVLSVVECRTTTSA